MNPPNNIRKIICQHSDVKTKNKAQVESHTRLSNI